MKQSKTSLNPIPLSMRGKKRYIGFELITGSDFDEKEVSKALWNVFLKLYGEVGVAKQKLWLIKWENKVKKGIVRCSLETEQEVKAGILFLEKVSGKAVTPKILKVSGSIGKLK